MKAISRNDIAAVARRLEPLERRTVFTGGAIVPFLLDDSAFLDMRPTKDVDVIVEVMTRLDFSNNEADLRALGFGHDTSEGAPKCRWILDDIKVDVMPAHDPTGEWPARWFRLAMETAVTVTIGKTPCRIIAAPCFVATKLEAFSDRGNNDYFASQDIEDVIAVIDGRNTLVDELQDAPLELGTFVAKSLALHLEQPQFLESLPGHLADDSGSQARLPMLMDRLRSLATMEYRK